MAGRSLRIFTRLASPDSIELIDSHSHIDTHSFDADRTDVVERARRMGVTRQVVPAIAREGWQKLGEICAQYPGLHAAYGLHPMYLDRHQPHHLQELVEVIEREQPVAIGECGLDFFVDGLDRDAQYHYFNRQLELARDFGLPVIVHARRAFDEVAACIRKTGNLRGIVHSFSGSQQQAENLCKLGFLLGIGGPVTYPRAKRLRAIVARLPMEFLVLETDSPDQPLHGHQGQRNEPALLREVLSTVAALRGESEAEVAASTSGNARRLFNLP